MSDMYHGVELFTFVILYIPNALHILIVVIV